MSPAEGAPLRVGSFNVRCGNAPDGPDRWELRRPRASEYLAGLDLDVVGLQEALDYQLRHLLRDLPEYEAVGVGRDDGRHEGEFAAILFRRDRLRLLRSGTFWFSATPDVPGTATWGNRCVRICTFAELQDPNGALPLTLFNVHLDHESQFSREKSVELLLARVDEAQGRVIVTGDFNADEDNPAVRRMVESGLVDAFRRVHPEEPAAGTFNGFREEFAPEKIDYIFVSPIFEVRCADIVRRKVNGRWPSDHAAVTATLS